MGILNFLKDWIRIIGFILIFPLLVWVWCKEVEEEEKKRYYEQYGELP